MPFPPSPREIYQTNPLEEVMCQIRYPAILAISTTTPAQFQDAIRDKYPWYEGQTNPLGIPTTGLPREVAEFLSTMPLPPMGQQPEHHFSIESRERNISLTQEFITVSETHYVQWEDFVEEVRLAERVLRETYTPSFYNRVGLRYINVLDRDELGLIDTPWSELLNSSFIGMLGDTDLADEVKESQVESLITLPDVVQGRVFLKHGLEPNQQGDNQVYVIDADFHTDRRSEPDGIFKTLERFNAWGGYLFRWATSDKLRGALGPTRI